MTGSLFGMVASREPLRKVTFPLLCVVKRHRGEAVFLSAYRES